MRFKGIVVGGVCLLALAGCAKTTTLRPQITDPQVRAEQITQLTMVEREKVKQRTRFQRVGYKVLKDNVDHCPKKNMQSGFWVWQNVTEDELLSDVLANEYDLNADVRVSYVVPKSAAAKAGIRAGDVIVSVNGQDVVSGAKGMQVYSGQRQLALDEMTLSVSRDGQARDIRIQNEEVCAYGLGYRGDNGTVNAFADGNNIVMTHGMMKFLESDTELALVVSHELAHNTMGHIEKKKANAMGAGAGGLVVDILFAAAGVNTQGAFSKMAAGAGAGAYSSDFEGEADYVGMYYLAKGGYKTQNVADFWRRMAVENDSKGVTHSRSHPTSAERFLAMNETHAEIEAKREKKEPLLPNMDPDVYVAEKDIYRRKPGSMNE